MRDAFSTLDIVKAFGIPRERLRKWMEMGFVGPTEPAKGRGTKAVFTRVDVYCVELFRHLLDCGFNREVAAEHISALKVHGNIFAEIRMLYFTYLKGRHGYAVEFDPDFLFDPSVDGDFVRQDPGWRDMYHEYKKQEAEFKRTGNASAKKDMQGSVLYLKDFFPYNIGEEGGLEKSDPAGQIKFFFENGVPYYIGEEWDSFHVVNFDKIKRRVNFALSSFK